MLLADPWSSKSHRQPREPRAASCLLRLLPKSTTDWKPQAELFGPEAHSQGVDTMTGTPRAVPLNTCLFTELNDVELSES